MNNVVIMRFFAKLHFLLFLRLFFYRLTGKGQVQKVRNLQNTLEILMMYL